MAPRKSRPRVFVDTSALIAALLSRNGGAGALLTLHQAGRIRFVISEYVLLELRRSPFLRQTRFRDHLAAFILSNPEICPLPSMASVRRAATVISTKDAPILASARAAKVEYLVTWDKEFLSPPIERWVGCSVLLPGDLLAKLRLHFK